jgi:hypothetical protein
MEVFITTTQSSSNQCTTASGTNDGTALFSKAATSQSHGYQIFEIWPVKPSLDFKGLMQKKNLIFLISSTQWNDNILDMLNEDISFTLLLFF